MQIIQYNSDIPSEAKEQFISPYRFESRCSEKGCGGAVWYEKREYWLNGQLRGIRQFEEDGTLMIERPYLNGKLHGTCYRWHENGQIDYVESFLHGEKHGNTYQYSEEGALMGVSNFVQGTGYATWWHKFIEVDKPGYFLSEIYFLKNGLQHGFEWNINEDQETLYIEQHFWEGHFHGIQRRWDHSGQLLAGYPQFWIMGEKVDQQTYMEATITDSRLPKFKVSDHAFRRKFPEDIRRIMRGEVVYARR